MTGFALPDSWSSLSRSVKDLVAHITRPVEAKTGTASPAPADLVELPESLTIQPSKTLPVLAPASKPSPGSGGLKVYAVDPRESVFASVFSLSGKATKTINALRPEATAEVLQVSQDVSRPHVRLVDEDLEEMERDLSTLNSLTSVLNVVAAQAAGFRLDEKAQLRIIKGIGPKTISMLNAAGIMTFSDLADCSINDLQRILRSAGPYHRLARPASWIQQANLASLNRWDVLKTLQATGPIRRRSKIRFVLNSVELNP